MPDLPMGTCDWGGCDGEQVGWAHKGDEEWLPICLLCLTAGFSRTDKAMVAEYRLLDSDDVHTWGEYDAFRQQAGGNATLLELATMARAPVPSSGEETRR